MFVCLFFFCAYMCVYLYTNVLLNFCGTLSARWAWRCFHAQACTSVARPAPPLSLQYRLRCVAHVCYEVKRKNRSVRTDIISALVIFFFFLLSLPLYLFLAIYYFRKEENSVFALFTTLSSLKTLLFFHLFLNTFFPFWVFVVFFFICFLSISKGAPTHFAKSSMLPKKKKDSLWKHKLKNERES